MPSLVFGSFASIQAPHYAQWSRDDELVPITSAPGRAGPIVDSQHRRGRKYHYTRQAHLKVRGACDVAGCIIFYQIDFVKDLRARRVIFKDMSSISALVGQATQALNREGFEENCSRLTISKTNSRTIVGLTEGPS